VPHTTLAVALDEASDQELLDLVAGRRIDAFEELYRRHAPAVHAVARRLTRDDELSSEVTQTAFMRLWDRAAMLDRESRLRAWLSTVAHNAALDRRRRKTFATVPLVDALDRAATSPGPDDEAIMTEDKRQVRTALRALPEEQRNAIELAYFGGLSQSEIAQLTGDPLGTVKGRIRLGMQRLRTLMTAPAGETA
jgi:RNA polymerase sigma-70 factor (ECF subfamily)